jgi:hypothetical protein
MHTVKDWMTDEHQIAIQNTAACVSQLDEQFFMFLLFLQNEELHIVLVSLSDDNSFSNVNGELCDSTHLSALQLWCRMGDEDHK